MKSAILGTLILVLLPCLAQAQSSEYSKGEGYLSFAPGGRLAGHDEWNHPTIQVGVGGEGYFSPHWGVGVDFAYLRSPSGDRIAARNWVILSPRAVARLRLQNEKNQVEPFVAGGYSLIDRQHSPNGVVFGEIPRTWWETEHGVNFGGGLDWWLSRSLGLRLELRDCIRFSGSADGNHLVSAHIGLTFR